MFRFGHRQQLHALCYAAAVTIAALCDDLNRTPTRFPGTRLTLRFAIPQPAATDPGG